MFFPLSSTVPGWGSQRRPCCCGQTPLKLSRVSPDPVAGTVRWPVQHHWTQFQKNGNQQLPESKQSNDYVASLCCNRTALRRPWGTAETSFGNTLHGLLQQIAQRCETPCSAVHRDGPRSLVTLKANVQLYGCKNEIHLSGCRGSRMHEVQLCTADATESPKKRRKEGHLRSVHWKNPRPNQAAYGLVRQNEVAWEPDCRRRNSLVPNLTDSNHMSSDPLGLNSGLRLLGRERIPQGPDCGWSGLVGRLNCCVGCIISIGIPLEET